MDAYVFVREAGEKAIEGLARLAEVEDSGIRFITTITGPYDALVAVTAEDLAELETIVLSDIRGTGANGTETVPVLPFPSPWPAPAASEVAPVEAFVQVRVEPGRATEVLSGLAELPGVLGVALVAGTFDILLEIGGETFEDVADVLLDRMHRVAGIVSTSSFFTATEG